MYLIPSKMSSHIIGQRSHSGLSLRHVVERPPRSMDCYSHVSQTAQGLASIEVVMATLKNFPESCHM